MGEKKTHLESWQRLKKHLCGNRRAFSTEIMHYPFSNLARRRSLGARRGGDANFPGGVLLTLHQATPRPGPSPGAGRAAAAAAAAAGKGGRESGPGLAGSRGGSARRPQPGNADSPFRCSGVHTLSSNPTPRLSHRSPGTSSNRASPPGVAGEPPT